MVSGSISLPLSGFFSPFPHGTGTLSVSWEYLALPDGPGRFAQNSTCSALLRILLCQSPLRLRGCHPLWPFFPKRSARINCTISQSYYPSGALLRRWFGLFPGRSPLLGESLLFSLPGGTKMFQFPPLALWNSSEWLSFWQPGCPIRKSSDQRSFASTRSLSQLITSFIGSWCQGIHHAPFVAWPIFVWLLPSYYFVSFVVPLLMYESTFRQSLLTSLFYSLLIKLSSNYFSS